MAKDMKGKGSVDQDLFGSWPRCSTRPGLSEIEIEREGVRVRVAAPGRRRGRADGRGGHAVPASGRGDGRGGQKRLPTTPSKHPGCVPLADGRHRLPGARARRAAFIEVGTRVTQGQTILIIEAMKTMNHIPAPKAGTSPPSWSAMASPSSSASRWRSSSRRSTGAGPQRCSTRS